jgi:hypothetical protein
MFDCKDYPMPSGSGSIRNLNMLLYVAIQAAAGAYDPQGVHVDPQGVLRSRTVDPDPRLAEIRKAARGASKEGALGYVSLNRLFAEARSGRLPATIGNLVKLRYVFVFPDEKDLVLAGPAEAVDGDPFRPLGKLSGRPALRLEDLVAALRAFAPGKRPDRLGCDIDIPRETQERIAAKIKAVGPAAQVVGFRKTCDRIAEAGGPQPLKFYGIEPDTRFAFVCAEADYRLKQLALGLMKADVESYRSRLLKPEREVRFSLESSYESLRASPDGLAFELRGPSLRVNGGLLGDPASRPEDMPAAGRDFVRDCNAKFDVLVRSQPSWADLCNLGDLSVLAALLTQDGLAEKGGLDLAWILESCPLPRMAAPTSAATLCNVSVQGQHAIFVTGGVWINPAEWASKRVSDDTLRAKAKREK